MGPLGTDIDAVKRQIEQLKNFKAEVDPHMVKVEALNRSVLLQHIAVLLTYIKFKLVSVPHSTNFISSFIFNSDYFLKIFSKTVFFLIGLSLFTITLIYFLVFVLLLSWTTGVLSGKITINHFSQLQASCDNASYLCRLYMLHVPRI